MLSSSRNMKKREKNQKIILILIAFCIVLLLLFFYFKKEFTGNLAYNSPLPSTTGSLPSRVSYLANDFNRDGRVNPSDGIFAIDLFLKKNGDPGFQNYDVDHNRIQGDLRDLLDAIRKLISMIQITKPPLVAIPAYCPDMIDENCEALGQSAAATEKSWQDVSQQALDRCSDQMDNCIESQNQEVSSNKDNCDNAIADCTFSPDPVPEQKNDCKIISCTSKTKPNPSSHSHQNCVYGPEDLEVNNQGGVTPKPGAQPHCTWEPDNSDDDQYDSLQCLAHGDYDLTPQDCS